jgi:hypothetical protein
MMKKGSMSGEEVIPMVILLLISAMMALNSLPITDVFSTELSETLTDVSRVSETKSYADMYFYNYVPMGAYHSVNQQSYDLGRNEGGEDVEWHYNAFSADKSSNLQLYDVVNSLEGSTTQYFNQEYGDTSRSQTCSIPDIQYTADLYPDQFGLSDAMQQNRNSIPVEIGSEINYEAPESGFGFPIPEAAPLEVECEFESGATRYVDTDGIGFATTETARANRYVIMANQTIRAYKDIQREWRSVGNVTNTDENVCDPSDSDWESLESQTVNDVDSNVTSKFYSGVGDGVNIPWISGDSLIQGSFELTSYELDLDYGDYDTSYDGFSSYSSEEVGNCNCHGDHDHDDDNNTETHCLDDEYDLTVEVAPTNATAQIEMVDEANKVVTDEGWKRLRFRVQSYYQEFQNDQSP